MRDRHGRLIKQGLAPDEAGDCGDVVAQDGDSLQVHYRVWDADTDELLDEGDLPVNAGADPNYIEGFDYF